jgi:hypothetical protein
MVFAGQALYDSVLEGYQPHSVISSRKIPPNLSTDAILERRQRGGEPNGVRRRV